MFKRKLITDYSNIDFTNQSKKLKTCHEPQYSIEDFIKELNTETELSEPELSEAECEYLPSELSENECETEETEEYEVEKILNKKIIDNQVYYLIKWKYYPLSANSWEPQSNLDCLELLNEYENKSDKYYQIKNTTDYVYVLSIDANNCRCASIDYINKYKYCINYNEIYNLNYTDLIPINLNVKYIYIHKIILDNNEFNKTKILKIAKSLNKLKTIDITFENLCKLTKEDKEFIGLLLQNYWIDLFNKNLSRSDFNKKLFNDIFNDACIIHNSTTIYDKCFYCNRKRLLTFNFNNNSCNNVGFYCAEKIHIIKKIISTIKNIKNNLFINYIYFPKKFIDVIYFKTIKLTTYANNNSNINKWLKQNNINDLDIVISNDNERF